MQERNQLIGLITKTRTKMNIRSLIKFLVTSLLFGCSTAALFEAVALFVPFYYAHAYALSALGIATITALVIYMFHRSSMRDSALYMDSFGFQEQIITAYENMDQDSPILNMQRRKISKELDERIADIHFSLLPSIKSLLLLLVLVSMTMLFALLPSPAKDMALVTHQVKENVKEQKEKIKETIEELEQMNPDELTAEEQELLQDYLNALQSSYSEFDQVKNNEELLKANDRLDFKMNQLNAISNSTLLQQALADTPVSNHSQMNNAGNNSQSNTQNGNPSTGGNNSDSNGDGSNQGSQNGQGNQDGQQGQSGQQGNQNGQGNQDGQQGQNGQQGQDGQQGQNGQQGNNGGQGGQNGQGGNGNQNGQGNQNGGAGQGQGGNGAGTGSATIPHDYISVPNDLSNDPSLAGKNDGGSNGNQFLAQNGLNWNGNHVPYSEVIGNYTNQAYEGLSQGRYPTGMENVIRDYFSNFN